MWREPFAVSGFMSSTNEHACFSTTTKQTNWPLGKITHSLRSHAINNDISNIIIPFPKSISIFVKKSYKYTLEQIMITWSFAFNQYSFLPNGAWMHQLAVSFIIQPSRAYASHRLLTASITSFPFQQRTVFIMLHFGHYVTTGKGYSLFQHFGIHLLPKFRMSL